MDTQQIKFIQGTVGEYFQMERYWHKRRRLKPDSVVGRVVNTLIYASYEKLFKDVYETEHPMLLRVREGKEFREVDPANLTDELIKELAGIAAADPTKRYYIELLAYESLAKACFTSMCFAEFEGSVILNEISIDSQMLDDFDAEADCVSGYYYGLWVPYDFKRRIGICIPEDYETNGPPHRRSNEHKPYSHQHRS